MTATFVAFFFTFLFALQGAMDDPSAIVKAKSIWGPVAMIGQRRAPGDTYWTKQVGCIDKGTDAFVVAGAGLNTWDAAFAAVDMAKNGQVATTAYLCNPMPLTVISPASATIHVGAQFSLQLLAAGGLAPYTWSIADPSTLPPGMALVTSSIFGTPTTAGTYTFTVQVQTTSDVPANLPRYTTTADLTITVQ